MGDNTVTLFFHWDKASADPRQYNQQRTLLNTNYMVAVEVPKTDEYIYNIDALENNEPILTLAGMVYADNQLTSGYRSKEEFDVDVSEVEWGDTVDETAEKWVDDIDDDEEDLEDVIDWEED